MVSLHRELKRGGDGTKNKEETQNLRKNVAFVKLLEKQRKFINLYWRKMGKQTKKLK